MKPIPEAALDQHIAILGKTGSGKSFTAKGIVERLLDEKRQVCVLDPTAAWWGLRLGADGKSRGYDVVLLGGAHADIPLPERSGAAVARLVTEQHANVVIDTSGMTVGEYTRWFIDFAGTLYTTIRSPLHLVIDEAHYFMPQGKSPDVDAGRMLHAGNRLMSGGRSKGVRGLMITQRPAKFHKDSLTCADTLIAMRMIAPQDRGAVKEWIDGAGDPVQGKEVLNSLAQLQRGEGWVWYPEGGHLERTKFPRIKTYDSSATPTHGAKAGPAVKEINLDEVKAAMAEAVKEAEANDPKLLRQEIAKLRAELTKKPVEVDTKAIELAVADAIARRDRKWDDLLRSVRSEAKRLRERSDVVTKAGEFFREIAVRLEGIELPLTARSLAAGSTVRQAPARREPSCASAQNGLTPRQQRFLDAAATLTTLNSEVTRETVSAWVGVHPRGGSVGEELKALADAGYLTIDRGQITVTEAGKSAAGYIDPKKAIESATAGLSPRQAKFFEMICAHYPNGVTRQQVGEHFDLHPRGGSLGEDLARLVGRGLVEVERGVYSARNFLFAGM